MRAHHARSASGREREVRRVQDAPGGQRLRACKQFLAAPADVLPRLGRLLHAHRGSLADAVLLHHHAVGARRQRRAREDPRGLSRRQRARPGRVTRGDLARQAQRSGHIGRAQRVAVHHRDVGFRLIAPRPDGFREHAAVCLGQGHVLGWKRPRPPADRGQRLVQRRQHLRGLARKQKSPGHLAEASPSVGGRGEARSGIRRRGVGGAEERTRTSTGLPPPDPESGVSANSTTSARRQKSRGDLADCVFQVKDAPKPCGPDGQGGLSCGRMSYPVEEDLERGGASWPVGAS